MHEDVRRLWPWVGGALAIRVIIGATAWAMQGEAAFLQSDSQGYLALARSLATRWRFEVIPGQTELFRTPGYPLLVALGARFSHPILLTLVLQLLLTVALMLLTFAIVRRATGNARAARIAAAATGFEPTLLLWSTQIMPETLFTVLLLAGIFTAQRLSTSWNIAWAVGAGLSLSAAALVRPMAYPLVVLLMAAAAVWSVRRSSRQRLCASIVVVICTVVLGAWHVRNAVATGYWGFSTQMDHAIYLSGEGAVTARISGESYADVRARLLAQAADLPPVATEGRSRFHVMRSSGWKAIRAHPATFLLIHLEGVVRTIGNPGAVEYFRLFGADSSREGLLDRIADDGLTGSVSRLARVRPWFLFASMAAAALTWPYVIAAAWSVWSGPPRGQPAYWLALILGAYLIIAGGGVPGSSRFRAPAVPLMVLMVTIAWDRSRGDRLHASARTN
jgi:4-amino-4-deoxy-L-arabinose transferase-like glycosyltransferase